MSISVFLPDRHCSSSESQWLCQLIFAVKWVLLLGQMAEVWRTADAHVFSSTTRPALMPSVCHSGESRKTGPTWLTRISGGYQLVSLTSFNINVQQTMSLFYFPSLSSLAWTPSWFLVNSCHQDLTWMKKDNGKKPGPFLLMDSSYQVSKSDDILAGWIWDYPRAPAASCFQAQGLLFSSEEWGKWQSQLTFGI